MKHLLFLASFLFILVMGAAAQTKETNKRHNTRHKKTTSASTAKTIDNTKNINWANGQKATVTGHDATSTNGEGFASLKDSAKKSVKH